MRRRSEWEEYANIKEVSLDPDAKDTEVLDAGKIDGLDDQGGTANLYAGRTFLLHPAGIRPDDCL